jgi:nucleoside-diphosphate-sugar epimerase
MRVFVNRATGFVGSAVIQELIGAGYKVPGLGVTDINHIIAKAEALCQAVSIETTMM